MQSPTDRITELIIHHLEGNLTDVENQELQKWMGESPMNRESVDLFLDEQKLQAGIRDMYHYRQKVWDTLQRTIETSNVIPITHSSARIKKWWLYAAVAIVIGLVAGTYLLFFAEGSSKSNEKNIANKPVVPQDMLPGKDGAILTLADGRQIVLDSAINGKISEAAIKKDNQLSYQNATNSIVEYNTMTTPKGRQYSLVLADGSKVWLNAASSITFPTAFKGNERKVEIAGEAYFEIAHDARKPFMVSVNGMEVQVLGTHFNINAYNDEATIKTTLLQGSVRVTRNNKVQMLSPGQQVQLGSKGEMELIKNADTDAAMAWRNGYFSFKDADLRTIMRQVARWYDVDVVFEGIVPVVEFSGEIGRQLTLTQFLSVLDETRVHYRIEGKKLVIVP